MKFLIAAKRKSHSDKPTHFQCVDVDRRGRMSDPYLLSSSQLELELNDGEVFHLLIKDGCTWNVGGQVDVGETYSALPEIVDGN